MSLIVEAEARYTLKQAAAMIPLPSVAALKMFLRRHPGIAKVRYQPIGSQRGRYRQPFRLLTASEVRTIQEVLSRGE